MTKHTRQGFTAIMGFASIVARRKVHTAAYFGANNSQPRPPQSAAVGRYSWL